jgi:hypothetical protein
MEDSTGFMEIFAFKEVKISLAETYCTRLRENHPTRSKTYRIGIREGILMDYLIQIKAGTILLRPI